MSRMVPRSLQRQIDQSNQNQDKSSIDTLKMKLIDRITKEVGFDSQVNKINIEERMNSNEVPNQRKM